MDPDLAVENAAMCRLGPINDAMHRGDSSVQKFYENAVVLVTGGTGFLGKHLLEKLFRSCDLKKVYLLVRQKKNMTADQRHAEIVNDMLFEDLQKMKQNFADKIEPLVGDIAEPRLGMNQADRQKIISEVDIIIHVAAVVNFTAPLQTAAIINVRGTREMLHLAKECLKLRCFVHVSTAYSHATHSRGGKEVLEDFYTSPISPASLIDLAETTDAAIMDNTVSCFLKDWPNTYTFTKAVGEELLRTTDGVPVCIVRPSTVLNAFTEPRPGWIDKTTLNGVAGLCHAVKMGLIHVIPGNSNVKVDYIPVDFVTNVVIAAAWETAARRAAGHKDVKIYTVCSTRNRLTLGEYSDTLYENANGVSAQALWYSTAMNVNNKFLYIILHWLVHMLPAYLIDVINVLFGRKPRYVKLYTKIKKISDVLYYFSTHQWIFRDGNTLALYQKMSPADQAIFHFDVLDIDWQEMMRLGPIGIRRFILKDGLRGAECAQKKQFWFKMASYFLLVTCVCIVGIVLIMFWQYIFYFILAYLPTSINYY